MIETTLAILICLAFLLFGLWVCVTAFDAGRWFISRK